MDTQPIEYFLSYTGEDTAQIGTIAGYPRLVVEFYILIYAIVE